MIRTLVAWVLLCVIWSTTWMVIKIGLADWPPLFFAGLRFAVAFAALALLAIVQRTPLPPRTDWWLIAWTGFLTFGINYGSLFWGEEHVPSGLAAILQATIPAFGMVFAHYYVPGERVTVVKGAGVVLGLGGVGIIFADKVHSADPLAGWGCVAVVLGALSVSFANVFIKARGRHLHPTTLAAGQMVFGFVPLLGVSLCAERSWLTLPWTPRAVLSLLYLAIVGSALTFWLLYWLLRHTEVTRVMMISLITPVAAVILGVTLLGEDFSWRMGAGAVCVLLGVSLVLNPFRGVMPLRAESALAE